MCCIYIHEPQDGYFLVVQDKATIHNITGTPPSAGFTVLPGIDVPNQYDMKPADTSTLLERNVDLSCSTNHSAPNLTQVDTCAKGRGVCCIDTGPYQVGEAMFASLSNTSRPFLFSQMLAQQRLTMGHMSWQSWSQQFQGHA